VKYYLFDEPRLRRQLYPFSLSRPLAHLRVGILTIVEKWTHYLSKSPEIITADYLQSPSQAPEGLHVLINAAMCPNPTLWQSIRALKPGQVLMAGQELLLAACIDTQSPTSTQEVIPAPACTLLQQPEDIFKHNATEIAADFKLLQNQLPSQPLRDPHSRVYAPENILIEEGADLKACVLNAEKGYIYIGKNAQVQEMSVLQGPFALCEGAVVNIGGKMRGATTIGPASKVGGEISNSVILGYSNKAHDGFLGNSVIGEWCNLGADTNTSNLKNNYSRVRLWSQAEQDYRLTEELFCGLMMGDHSKAGINTMFNTGTVLGMCVNVVGGDFPPKHLPSFTWYKGAQAQERYDLEKALATIEKVMQRRGRQLQEAEKAVLRYVFEHQSLG
jgi:UDP-N-acetylglucosamine diphosphorylase/glucosamine-1-phosphate N-acetyltransferase